MSFTPSSPTSSPPPTSITSTTWYGLNPSTLPCNICSFNNSTLVLIPVIVVYGLIQNGFALEVLQSPFLSDLPSQPIIKALLTLHSALLITGPLYLWLTHVFGALLTVNEVCPCFFLSWFHEFLTVTTSWLMVIWMLERTVTIARLKETWVFWRMRFLEVSVILVGVALILTVTGAIFKGTLSGAYRDVTFSVDACLPWLDIERIIAFPNWPRAHAVLFSLAPGVTLLFFFVSLMTSLYYLSYRVNQLFQDRSHYQINLAIVRNNTQLKFVYSLVWICPVFFLTCAPIGLSIFSMCSDLRFKNPLTRHHIYPVEGMRIDYGGIYVDDFPVFESSLNFSDYRNETRGGNNSGPDRGLGVDDPTGRNTVSTTKDHGSRAGRNIIYNRNHPVNRTRNIFEKNAESDGDGIINNPHATKRLKHAQKMTDVDNRVSTSKHAQKMSDVDNDVNTSKHAQKMTDDDGVNTSKHVQKMTDVDIGVNTSKHAQKITDVNKSDENGTKWLKKGSAVLHGKGNTPPDGGQQGEDMEYWGPHASRGDSDEVDLQRQSPLSAINMLCALWLVYYGFSVVLVPLLLLTEPLFRTEWCHTWREFKICCCYSWCFSPTYFSSERQRDLEALPVNERLSGNGPDQDLNDVDGNGGGNLNVFIVQQGELTKYGGNSNVTSVD